MCQLYPLAPKRRKENFDKLVDKCISRETITKDLVRKFSGRARRYMLTYKSLEMRANSSAETEVESKMSLAKIESMTKIIKSHRAALDFDKNFIMKSVTAADFSFEEEVELASEKKAAGKKRKRA